MTIETPTNILSKSAEAFIEKAENILESFLVEIDKKAAPNILYHYTDNAGLHGILASGSLWLTDIFYLNDTSELRHGLSHSLEALKDIGNDVPTTKIFTKLFEAFTEYGIREAAHFFVACFRAETDDLGQWRAYGDDGRGFALGFDRELLEQAFISMSNDLSTQHMTFPVTYDDDKLQEIHEKLASTIPSIIPKELVGKPTPVEVQAYTVELITVYSVASTRASQFFKHPAYRSEKEYRFLQIQRGDQQAQNVKYRNSPHSLKRYIEFSWRDLAADALKEIVIGPSANMYNAEQYARDCLRAFHNLDVDKIKITKSDIPYRSSKF